MNAQYIIAVGNEQQGPYSFEDLLMFEQIGDVNDETLVRLADHDIWKKWSEFKAQRLALLTKKRAFEQTVPGAEENAILERWGLPQRAPQASAPMNFAQGNATPSAARLPILSRGIYIGLALFLGSIGIHNFYAGHSLRGILQLILSLAGIALFAAGFAIGLLLLGGVAVWCLAEIVTETEDGHGRHFR